MIFLCWGNPIFGNFDFENFKNSTPLTAMDDCAKGLAFPVFAGSVLTANDTIPVCESDITGTNDIEFDIVSVLDFPGLPPAPPGNSYFLRYIINGMAVVDPNISSAGGGNVVSTSLEGATFPIEFDGVLNSAFNQTIQDDVTLSLPSDFQLEAILRYSITVQLMEMPAVGDPFVSPTCAPKGFMVNAKIYPTADVTASLVDPNDAQACADQSVLVTAAVPQSSSNIQSFTWSVLSADPGFGGSFLNPFAANSSFSGTIDNSIVARGQSGIVRVQVEFTDGNGCSSTDQLDIELFRAIGALACNDKINISLDSDCEVEIDPDAVLEGSYGNYPLFEVIVFDRNRNVGNTVDGSLIGKTLTVRVVDKCSGNHCWGQLVLEDKFAPVIDCSLSSFKTNIITGTLDSGDGRFHRSVAVVQGNSGSCILSPLVGTRTLYQTTNFNVTVPGIYTFEMLAAQEDYFGAIYQTSFNPNNACQNIVDADDDSAAFPFAPKMSPFLAAGDYVLVTSAHFNNGKGAYQWQVLGPPNGNGINQGICKMNSDTISVACTADLSLIPPPVATDNCEGIIIPTLIAETSDNFGCGRADGTVGIVTRTWRATDSRGNVSNTCTQAIKLIRKNLSNIVFPPNYDDQDQPAFSCNGPMNLADPDNTGYPTIDGSPVLVGNICMLNLDYEDLVLPTCGSGKKIIRTWTVLDWCEPLVTGVNPLISTQLIKFIDKTAPQITCVDDFTVSADNNDCTADALLPAILASDNCGSTTIQISTPYGVLNTNGGVINGFPIGDYDIKYTVSDECGNDTSCVAKMTVIDNLEPVAICIELLSVSLTSNGMAEINATAFDAGSYDNCCLDFFEVKRMSQPNRDYGPSVVFDCDDIPNITMVNVRVWDCYGNSNECMVEVETEDKLRPTLVCPPNITLGCNDDPFDLAVTGDVTNLEVCAISNASFDDDVNIDKCDIGTVRRTFTASDASGNTGRCVQMITIINNNPFDPTLITWPRDTMFIDDCGRGMQPDSLPAGYNYPVYPDNFCADLYKNYEDTRFDRVAGVCLKVIRKWTIIDWCQYDRGNPGNGGRWEYEQEVAVMDGKAPDIVCPDPISVSVAKYSCLAQINIDTARAWDCSSSFTHHISGDFNTFGVHDSIAIGDYEVTIGVKDGCGNLSTCDLPITVRDSVPPTAKCDGIHVNIDSMSQMAWIKASMLNLGNKDNCSGFNVTFSFSADINDTMRNFTCIDVGTIDVTLYVFDQNGNSDFCRTTIDLQDNTGTCGGSKTSLAGTIKNERKDPVSNVDIALSGTNAGTMKTNSSGIFEFINLNSGGDFTVFPACNEDFDNGVSTFDILLITKHILNIGMLDSPYKMIAADANRSGSISTLDIIALRKLILQTETELPNQNTSWRFVNSDYIFPDSNNPWAEVFPEIYNVNNLNQTDQNVDFTAVKVGDVSGDADMTNSGKVAPRTLKEQLTFQVQNQFFEKGEVVQVDFTAMDFENILGYQGTINFDNEVFDLTEIVPGAIANEDNFGKSFVSKGILTTSWNSATAEKFDNETILFSLVFEARRGGSVSSAISFDGSRTRAESYRADGELLDVKLDVSNEISAVQLFQNEPNPFSAKTTIRFFLPEKMNATLSIVDVSGKTVKVFTEKYDRGTNEIELFKSDLPQVGVLYYRLQTDEFNGVKKMLLID